MNAEFELMLLTEMKQEDEGFLDDDEFGMIDLLMNDEELKEVAIEECGRCDCSNDNDINALDCFDNEDDNDENENEGGSYSWMD